MDLGGNGAQRPWHTRCDFFFLSCRSKVIFWTENSGTKMHHATTMMAYWASLSFVGYYHLIAALSYQMNSIVSVSYMEILKKNNNIKPIDFRLQSLSLSLHLLSLLVNQQRPANPSLDTSLSTFFFVSFFKDASSQVNYKPLCQAGKIVHTSFCKIMAARDVS